MGISELEVYFPFGVTKGRRLTYIEFIFTEIKARTTP
jgi:hypothetical protein